MTSAYNKVNRLRQQGLTWDQLGREISSAMGIAGAKVARNTLRSIQSVPHYRPGKALVIAIDQVNEHHNPNPFPKGVNGLLQVCRNLMLAKNKQPRELILLKEHVIELLDSSSLDVLVQCRLHWILGNIYQYEMRLSRLSNANLNKTNAYQQQAVQHFKRAYNLLGSDFLIERYKLIHNQFVCFVNAVEEMDRNNNAMLIDQLTSLDYLDCAFEVIKQEPFQWEAARNALLYSSITHDREAIARCFELMIGANALFSDLAYKPFRYDSILDDRSLKWALKNVLTPNYVETVLDKINRAGTKI